MGLAQARPNYEKSTVRLTSMGLAQARPNYEDRARCVKRESLKARVQRRLRGVEMTEVEVHMATYSRRQVAHRQYKFDHDGG